MLTIRHDDLTGAPTRALVARHIAGMYVDCPPESVHSLDVSALQTPEVVFLSAWMGEEIAGIGALQRLDAERGEIKSMRTADEFLSQGVGCAIMDALIEQARAMGLKSLWIETGSTPPFVASRALYERAGFTYCPPFDAYWDDPQCVFMTRNF